jgi:branched-chain amino acid transport system permease protein
VHEFIGLTEDGLFLGAIYAIAASGLVLTYTTSGIFNIAHGAIGMVMAFVFWDLVHNAHIPSGLAFAIVVLVLAPLSGALIERLVIRRVPNTNVTVTLVITVGLTLIALGLAQEIFGSGTHIAPDFASGGIHVLGILVPWYQFIAMLAAIAIAAGLRLFLYRTRTGIAMRGVVDNRELVGLFGGRAARFATLSWALGASLASVAGCLVAPLLQLQPQSLTLLVIDAYAAAIIGRLRNLPMTFVGGIVVGLAASYSEGYLPFSGSFWASSPVTGLKLNVPAIILFLALLAIPVSRLRAGSLQRQVSLATASLSKSVGGGVVLVAGVIVAVSVLSAGDVAKLGIGLATALICLSLVPLTGWGGQVSICQLTFAGIGAYVMSKWGGGGSLLGYLGAAGVAGAVGAFVSLFALRLRLLYLALATMAFASLMDQSFFSWGAIFGYGGSTNIPRPNLFGYHVTGDKAFDILLAVVFALLSIGLLAMRRGPFGRVLIAMKDSEAACATLGLSLTMTKLAVFTLSAAMAGFAGALYGGAESVAGPLQFIMFKSLLVLAAVSIGGVSLCTSALIGGIALGYLPLNTSGIFIGVGVLFLARYSEGLLPSAFAWITRPLAGTGLRRVSGPAPPRLAGTPA